jgi:RNA polymerase sigma-B factor
MRVTGPGLQSCARSGAEAGPARPACDDLADAGDQDLLAIVQSAPPGSRERDVACEALVLRYQSLVRYCAQRYLASPASQEELMQVGYLGLLKAINRFDPAQGTGLRAYAEPCIQGELKRYFRDDRWQVHVRRGARDLRLELRASTAELTHQLGRRPSDAELARHMRVSDSELADAQYADQAFEALSLDFPLQIGQTLADTLGGEDRALEQLLDEQALWTHWRELPRRQQRLLVLRFYGEMTQAEIGQRLGISQMQVSRLLSRALSQLRTRLLNTAADQARP